MNLLSKSSEDQLIVNDPIEIGDPSRFKDWKQLCKLAGFNLVENSSGERKGQRHISKRGRAALRNYLYQVAVTVVANNNEFRQLYQYLMNRKQNPLKKKAGLGSNCNQDTSNHMDSYLQKRVL